MSAMGLHLILDLFACDRAVLDDEGAIRAMMIEGAKRSGANVIGERFHKFEPQGVSGVVILAESHLAIHTWPEHGFAAVDLFTCSAHLDAESCFGYLRDRFRCRASQSMTLRRGEHDAIARYAALGTVAFSR